MRIPRPRWTPVGAALAVSASGCAHVTTGTGDAGGGALAQMSSNSVPGSGDGGVQGTQCLADATGQVVLCGAISACPGLTVDPGTFPDCGFRLRGGSALDLECACADALCPIGAPTTCDEARRLLAAQSALLVCQQLAEDRCLPFGSGPASSGAGAGGTCDRACEAECAGAPACIQLCGC
ncbi:MAG: hypothetical protein JOZ69_06635 [Myxococcales bacterium]|nr:hypothetical protein [Myxococcales bacterium]